jgi:ankyrin repeat protein
MDERLPSWINLECGESPRRVSAFGGDGGSPSLRRSPKQEHASNVKRRQDATVDNSHESPEQENRLIELSRKNLWSEALLWCRLHPEDASPRICVVEDPSNPYSVQGRKRAVSCGQSPNRPLHDASSQTVYYETALGITCASDMTLDPVDIIAFIQALLEACPQQVSISQFISGHTPLRDAVRNCSCPKVVVDMLLDVDHSLVENSVVHAFLTATEQPDRDGQYPVDHLIKAIHLGWPGNSLAILPRMIDLPDLSSSSHEDSVQPLVRLFSLGNSFGLLSGSSTLPQSQSPEIDHPRLGRILECTRDLLTIHPTLVYQYSRTTGCSPLHVALRNYGNFPDLIRLLLERDVDGTVMRHRNYYGDLPLHVACSSGVPVDILRLVLARTRSASSSTKWEPHSLVWSTNHSGYTPVDLEWIRHIEAGHGFFSHRSFLPLDPRGVRKACGRHDELYSSLLRQAVDEVVLSTSPVTDKTFGLLLHRIFMIIRGAFRDSSTRSPLDLSDAILHQAVALSGPSEPLLPQPILKLILSQHPEQLDQRDHFGKLPLHHAVQVRKALFPASTKSANEWVTKVKNLLERCPHAYAAADSQGRLPLHCALDFTVEDYPLLLQDARAEVVRNLATAFPKSVETRDPVLGLYPFMQAAASPGVPLDTVFWLLRRSPDVVFHDRFSVTAK